MKSKARFLPFVLALALLTSLFVLSHATAATGSVTLDKSHIKAPDGMVGITVNDPAANVGVVQNAEAEGAGGGSYVIPGRTIAGNEAVRFRTAKSPILTSSAADLTGEGSDDSNTGVDYRDVVLNVVIPDGTNETTTNAIMGAWEALTAESTVGGDGRHPFSLENPQGGAFILRSANAVNVPEGGIAFTVTYKAPDARMRWSGSRARRIPRASISP